MNFNTDTNHPSLLFGKIVALIGASGFIGSHLVDLLLKEGCVVRCFSRKSPGLINNAALENPLFSFKHLDISNADSLNDALHECRLCSSFSKFNTSSSIES